jgi:hypothetical protein
MELFCNTAQHEKRPLSRPFVQHKSLILKAGGGGRTRTYEGLASGFTVRPLCHSGHSPMPAGSSLADENAPGWPRRVCGKAYVASRLGLSTGNMTLIGRRDGGASMLRGAAPRVGAPNRKGSFSAVDLASIGALAMLRKRTGRSARRPEPNSEGAPPPISTASRPCAPSAAGRRSSPRRGRRPGSPPHRPRSGRRFRDRRRPRQFR